MHLSKNSIAGHKSIRPRELHELDLEEKKKFNSILIVEKLIKRRKDNPRSRNRTCAALQFRIRRGRETPEEIEDWWSRREKQSFFIVSERNTRLNTAQMFWQASAPRMPKSSAHFPAYLCPRSA